jgi:hypothetical protein
MVSASYGRRVVGWEGVFPRVSWGETTLGEGWISVTGGCEDGPGPGRCVRDVYRPGLGGSRSVIGLDGRVGRDLGIVRVGSGSGSGSGGLRTSRPGRPYE